MCGFGNLLLDEGDKLIKDQEKYGKSNCLKVVTEMAPHIKPGQSCLIL
jgi:hypothetical protein